MSPRLVPLRCLVGLAWWLLAWPAGAQPGPPPGGWPLRPVAELRVVSGPPGGLVPYRAGQRWGFADTTGRVWIQPVLADEPPLWPTSGLLLLPPHQVGAPAGWNRRYGNGYWEASRHEPLEWEWGLTRDYEAPLNTPTRLFNARGELLLAQPDEALLAAPDGAVRVARRTLHSGGREVVAVQPAELGRPFALRTVTARDRAPGPPPRLLHPRRFALAGELTEEVTEDPTRVRTPRYLARQVNRWHPARQVWRTRGCYGRRLETAPRFRHGGRLALFDQRGRRLTSYRWAGVQPLLPGCLLYREPTDSSYFDDLVADNSGLPRRWWLNDDQRYGVLDLRGRPLTPAHFVQVRVIGPNALWVAAVRHGQLHYGLLDTLGRYLLPLHPGPLSLPDAAGLLRQYGTAPQPRLRRASDSDQPVAYPDTATVRYLHPDGRPAFAGRFGQAGGFWQGRALVRQGGQYGLLDSRGRWVLPWQPTSLSYYALAPAHHSQEAVSDPLELFPQVGADGPGGPWWGSAPGDSLLLLTHNARGYGLQSSRTGRVLVPPTFDERPTAWHGAVVGTRQGRPLGVSTAGQWFDPRQPASIPPGVRPLQVADGSQLPPVTRTPQGYRTRGGQALWQD